MKLFKYITIALSSLFMCGCSDYLDNAPDDTLTMEMVSMTGLVLKTGYLVSTIVCLILIGRYCERGDTILWGMILIRRNVGTNGGETL